MPEIRHMSFFKPIIYSGGDPSDLHDDPVKEQKSVQAAGPAVISRLLPGQPCPAFWRRPGCRGLAPHDLPEPDKQWSVLPAL